MTVNDPWVYLAALAGSWRMVDGDRVYEENWLYPAGQTMQGTARHIRHGTVVFMEFFSIEVFEDRLSLNLLLGSPTRGSKTPKHFGLSSATSQEIVFENDQNEFPTRIVYALAGQNQLSVTLSNGARSEVLHFRRA